VDLGRAGRCKKFRINRVPDQSSSSSHHAPALMTRYRSRRVSDDSDVSFGTSLSFTSPVWLPMPALHRDIRLSSARHPRLAQAIGLLVLLLRPPRLARRESTLLSAKRKDSLAKGVHICQDHRSDATLVPLQIATEASAHLSSRESTGPK
jgi:hypothetical protein